jgi:hypothetical protein
VYSTHGGLDPWRFVGIRKSVNAESPFKLIQGDVFFCKKKNCKLFSFATAAAHVADLYSITDDDSNEMKSTKEHLLEWIRYLVKGPNNPEEDGSENESDEEQIEEQ